MNEKRGCFGTHEYSEGHSICKGCEWYKECGKVAPPNATRLKRKKRKKK